MTKTGLDIAKVGTPKSVIDVTISYRIIELFSEGLYKSPHKAIEELVTNAFDAGATATEVVVPQNLADNDAIIAVIDNGTGMDEKGLEAHWQIGVSEKRNESFQKPKNRAQIGKFGIGKLATFVLAYEFTHITKVGKKYFAVTMDYRRIPHGENGGLHAKDTVKLPLRELSEIEAKEVIQPIIDESKESSKKIKLFGKGAAETWTVAILSNLKDMAKEIKLGRLKWVLETAMPLRDDFTLFLNGNLVKPSKADNTDVNRWILGKDLIKIPRPASQDLTPSEDRTKKKEELNRFALIHPNLGQVYGYV